MEKRLRIVCCTADPVVRFAAQELKKYLRMMMPSRGDIEIGEDSAQEGFHLGVFEAFGIREAGIDNRLDDVIHIKVEKECGVIAGSNPRSTLAAIYRYLHLCGCRWPRPGVDGELIPLSVCIDADYRHRASHRHRGLCIEGAVSQQNMLENIDWAPKVGYNSYFLEFKTPYTFFDRWYTHRDNPKEAPEPVSVDNVRQYCAALEAEVQKRGLWYHAVGHAWTCEPLGIRGDGWDPVDLDIGDETRKLLALVNGKRELYDGITLNTNLCYSNPKAREVVVQYCADYTERNSQIDYVHVWLADGHNNHCECPECGKKIPPDFYVMLLNEIDAEFTKRGLPTKIVFIIYLDVLWPPKTETLNNPDRFCFLFGPITRDYSEPYTARPFEGKLPEFRRNKLEFPHSVAENIALLQEWRKQFSGDGLAYEYYFWLDHYNDPGYYDIAKIISEDIKTMRAIGINGLISDQTQRSFFPTGFPMYLMGQTLYDASASFDGLAEDFFTRCYGSDGEKCRAYMAELSRLFDPAYLRGRGASKPGVLKEYVNAEAAKKLRQVEPLVRDFRKVIEANLHSGVRCMDVSWKMLLPHGELCEKMAEAYVARAEGNFDEARALWEKTLDFARMCDLQLQDVFDVCTFVHAIANKF